MELYQLRYFVEVAREQSFTRAARRLNLATPALSLQIQNLEKERGTGLLIRGQRQTVLTPAGEILFEKAQALLGMAESVKQSVVEVSELRAGKLTIAFIPALGTYWLADMFRNFRREYPCVNLVLQEETSLGVAALVEDSSTELGFLQLPCNNQLFEAREIWNEPFFGVLRENVVPVPVREPKLFREVGLISRRGKELSAAARAFVDLIKKAPFPASPTVRAELSHPHVPELTLAQTN